MTSAKSCQHVETQLLCNRPREISAQPDDRDPIDFIHPKPIFMVALCKTTQCNARAGPNKYTSTLSNQITMAMIFLAESKNKSLQVSRGLKSVLLDTSPSPTP